LRITTLLSSISIAAEPRNEEQARRHRTKKREEKDVHRIPLVAMICCSSPTLKKANKDESKQDDKTATRKKRKGTLRTRDKFREYDRQEEEKGMNWKCKGERGKREPQTR
jgi:hypothetical protein